MTKQKKITVLFALVLLTVLWTWQYITVNNYYAQMDKSSIQYFPMNEDVPFGDDFIEWNEQANGYYVRVNRFEILDYDEYWEENCFNHAPMLEAEKIALVHITLRNDDSNSAGIYLTDFVLHGIDSYQGMDWEALTAANPILAGGFGIRLASGTQQEFVLPYYIKMDSFGIDTWRNIENYPFYLRITAFPTQKDIVLNENNGMKEYGGKNGSNNSKCFKTA